MFSKHQSGTDPALLKSLQSLIMQKIKSQGSTLVDWPPFTPSCQPSSPLSKLLPHRLFPEHTRTPGLLLSPHDLCIQGAFSRFSHLPPSYHFPNILLKVFFSEKSSQTWVLSGVLTGLNVFWLKRGAVPVAWQWEVLSNEGKSQAGTLEIILKCIGPLSHDIANRTRSLLFNLVFITRGYHRATEMWIWSPGHLTGLDPL